MKNQIEIMNEATGETRDVDASAILSDVIGARVNISIDGVAAELHPLVKGVSAAKISEVVALIVSKDTDFFASIQQLRDMKPRRFRLTITEVDAVDVAPEPEPMVEQVEETPEPEVDEAASIAAEMDADLDRMGEADDDLHAPDEPEESDDHADGYLARMQGVPSKDGPPIDAPERDEWYLGWKKADGEDDAPEIKEPEAEQVPDVDATAAGQQARLRDEGPDANPFDGGTDEHAEWVSAYNAADAEVKSLIEDGRKAAAEGQPDTAAPWKDGTDAHRFWMQGWNAEQA